MKKPIIVFLTALTIAAPACSIPSMGDIHLSDCINACNATNNVCLNVVNDAGVQCLDGDAGAPTGPDASYNEQQSAYKKQAAYDQACAETQTQQGEACGSTLIKCISACIKQTEDQLKQ